MQSIVNGLEAQYGEQVDFISLNALDGGQGQEAFQAYGLRGHPTVVLVQPEGQVSAIRPGIMPGEDLEQAIQDLLAP